MKVEKENLKEFVNRRMVELGLTYKAFFDAGIGAQTFQNVRKGIVFRMAEVTKEKLAKVLQCSIGDINSALAVTNQITPFNEEITKVKPSAMETVDRLEEMVKEDHPEKAEQKQEGNLMYPKKRSRRKNRIRKRRWQSLKHE